MSRFRRPTGLGRGPVLVAGRYPPVPGEAAAATVAAVRRAWAAGAEVVVASPRPSAAPLVLTRTGAALGREVAAVSRRCGCRSAVICAEPGWPFVYRGSGRAERAARSLARSLARLDDAELVVTGPVADWAPLTAALCVLRPAVDVVTASSEQLAALLKDAVLNETGRRPPWRRAQRPATLRVVPPPVPGALRYLPPEPVGPLEPGELSVKAHLRRFLGRTSRRLFGRHAPAVRAQVARWTRPARRLVRGVARGGPWVVGR